MKSINYFLFIGLPLLCSCDNKHQGTSNEWSQLEGVNRIVCIGNSLTIGETGNGVTYPNALAELTGIPTVNLGVGGQTSTQIAARVGAIPLTVTLDKNLINNADSIAVLDKNINVLYDSGKYKGEIEGALCGIDGKMTTDSLGNWWFHPSGKPGAVDCLPNSLFIPKTDFNESDYFIFWLGRNNYDDIASVISDTKACTEMADKLGCGYKVLSVLTSNTENEWRDGEGFNVIGELNKKLEYEYPNNYIDVLRPLISAYDSSSVEDSICYARRVTPQSLRSDAIHLTADGYRLLGEIIAEHLKYTKSQSFVPGALWLDNNGRPINAHGAGLLKDGDTYYLYGEHKVGGNAGNRAHVGVHCYSSKDLYNWKDEGVALPLSEDPESLIAEDCILERPKVVFNPQTGKYVMWFHLELKGKWYEAAMCGVAVSDNPTGPFEFVEGFRPNDNQMSRDMTLFQDEDGMCYQICASEDNATLHISPLTSDYLHTTDTYSREFEGRYMEAPAMFKHEGKYYLIMSGCTGWAPNAGRSAVADNIMGPWTELNNPFLGNGADTSFDSQSTYVLPSPANDGTFIYIGDRWMPQDAVDGRYICLPLVMDGDQPTITWNNVWKY